MRGAGVYCLHYTRAWWVFMGVVAMDGCMYVFGRWSYWEDTCGDLEREG